MTDRDALYRKALSCNLSSLTPELRQALIDGDNERRAAHAAAGRTAFRVIPCTCGHAPADHARGPRAAPPGICHRPGCGCQRYADADLAAFRATQVA